MIVSCYFKENRNLYFLFDVKSLTDFLDYLLNGNSCFDRYSVFDPNIKGLGELGAIFFGAVIKGIGKNAANEYLNAINKHFENAYGAKCVVGPKGCLSDGIHVIDSNDNHHRFDFPFDYRDLHEKLSSSQRKIALEKKCQELFELYKNCRFSYTFGFNEEKIVVYTNDRNFSAREEIEKHNPDFEFEFNFTTGFNLLASGD